MGTPFLGLMSLHLCLPEKEEIGKERAGMVMCWRSTRREMDEFNRIDIWPLDIGKGVCGKHEERWECDGGNWMGGVIKFVKEILGGLGLWAA